MEACTNQSQHDRGTREHALRGPVEKQRAEPMVGLQKHLPFTTMSRASEVPYYSPHRQEYRPDLYYFSN